jgi:hypothetical protein
MAGLAVGSLVLRWKRLFASHRPRRRAPRLDEIPPGRWESPNSTRSLVPIQTPSISSRPVAVVCLESFCRFQLAADECVKMGMPQMGG